MGKTENLDFHDFWYSVPIGFIIFGFGYTKLISKTQENHNTITNHIVIWNICKSEMYFGISKSRNIEHATFWNLDLGNTIPI